MQGSGQPGPALHERFARAIAKTVMAPGFVIARPRRGRGNLAVPCRISGKPRRKRDRLREIATSAVGLLAMTNLGAIAFLTLARTSRRCSAGRGCPLPYNTACGRRWLVRAATAFPRLPRRFAPRNDTSGGCSGNNGASYQIGAVFAASRTGMAVPAPTLICETARNEISIHKQNKL